MCKYFYLFALHNNVFITRAIANQDTTWTFLVVSACNIYKNYFTTITAFNKKRFTTFQFIFLFGNIAMTLVETLYFNRKYQGIHSAYTLHFAYCNAKGV